MLKLMPISIHFPVLSPSSSSLEAGEVAPPVASVPPVPSAVPVAEPVPPSGDSCCFGSILMNILDMSWLLWHLKTIVFFQLSFLIQYFLQLTIVYCILFYNYSITSLT